MTQIDWRLQTVSFGWSGEPLLNRELPAMIATARASGAGTYVSTNGLLLERDCEALLDSGLTMLRICLDGVDQEMASKYRVGIKFEEVIRGTQKVSALRKARDLRGPRISLQMLVTRHTESHFEEFIEVAKRCGVDEVYFKSFNISLSDWLPQERRQELAKEYLPSDHRFLRYRLNGSNEFELRPELRNTPCPEIESGVTILHTGDVVPCCEDFSGSYILGNIRRTKLSEIWHGESYERLRASVRGRELSMCNECSYPGSEAYNKVVHIRAAT
jgi:radical SAM protein with 4Fe4S-binding SPASM domain